MTSGFFAKHARGIPHALAFTLLACVSLCASAGMEAPEDTAAVRAVKLDMGLVQRVAATTRELQKLPPAAAPLKSEGEHAAPAMHGQPVAKMASQIDASPQARAILASHRLGAREYGLSIYAILNCTVIAATTPPGTSPGAADLERASVTAANARFCQANLAEITKLMNP